MIKRKEFILKKLEGIYEEHLELLDFLLQNEEDVELFEKEYKYSKLDKVSIIYDFRIIQRIIKSIGKEEFLQLYGENKKAALEKLFQEPLTNDDVDYFVQVGKPLGEVYQLSTGHLNLQLHILLERWDFVKRLDKISSFADLLDD
ncbi:hypothetical protein [Oceanobacillus oncorhynchi]|uniref:hypothetical protein n=1 Tax=Oceanobacillus oncorhynchi TaxID=545501 RepID=UPI0034D4092E